MIGCGSNSVRRAISTSTTDELRPGLTSPGRQLDSTPPGAIAQLGERLLCKQEVAGSIPAGSTEKGPGNP
jgi:hypothetical protein